MESHDGRVGHCRSRIRPVQKRAVVQSETLRPRTRAGPARLRAEVPHTERRSSNFRIFLRTRVVTRGASPPHASLTSAVPSQSPLATFLPRRTRLKSARHGGLFAFPPDPARRRGGRATRRARSSDEVQRARSSGAGGGERGASEVAESARADDSVTRVQPPARPTRTTLARARRSAARASAARIRDAWRVGSAGVDSTRRARRRARPPPPLATVER